MTDYAEVFVWPVTLLILVLVFRSPLAALLRRAQGLSVEALGTKVTINPTELGSPQNPPLGGKGGSVTKKAVGPSDLLPADYFFLNHISFVREEKQEDFRRRTGVTGTKHYDIRVVVESFYEGALDQILCVEYLLHASYPEPVQVMSDSKSHFLLKEVANGEYVLVAKVHIRDRLDPVVLSRYISLGDMKKSDWIAWLEVVQPDYKKVAS